MKRWMVLVAVAPAFILALAVLGLVAETAEAAIGDLTIDATQDVTWPEEGEKERNITGKVSVYGKLTVHDYTLLFNITQDGEASFWVYEGGTLVFDNVHLVQNGSYYMFFKVSGTFICRDSDLEGLTGDFTTGGGIKCVDGTVELHDTEVHHCKAMGVFAEGLDASVLLEGCTVYNMSWGLVARGGAQLVVRNTTIELFDKFGVNADGAGLEMVDCVVNGSYGDGSDLDVYTVGVGAVRSSEVTMTRAEIHQCIGEALQLVEGTTATLENCNLHNNTVGVGIDECKDEILIYITRISGNTDGLHIKQSNNITVRECRLVGNVNGITSKDCPGSGYILEDCHIGGNTQFGAFVIGTGFNEEGTTWTDEGGEPNGIGRLLQKWTVDIEVQDADDNPAIGAHVRLLFPDGSVAFNGSTDSVGMVQDIKLEGSRVLQDGTVVEMDDYTVKIVKGKKEAEKAFAIDRDKTITVVLGKVEEVSPLSSPYAWAIIGLLIIALLAGFGYYWVRIR